jgi:hypothetical protein
MRRVKTSAIKCAVLSSAIVVGLVAVLSAQSVAQADSDLLPPVESIGPRTNIRVFLLPDVPQVLHVAAVRRAWRMDPAIRDFKEMAENDWDFTATGGVLGFGEIDPNFDAQGMVAEMMSKPGLTLAERFRSTTRQTQTARAGFWSGFFVR